MTLADNYTDFLYLWRNGSMLDLHIAMFTKQQNDADRALLERTKARKK